jgi:hypothetical protein
LANAETGESGSATDYAEHMLYIRWEGGLFYVGPARSGRSDTALALTGVWLYAPIPLPDGSIT